MPAHITLLRHAETEANASDVWQGIGDSPLTKKGESQVEALRERLRERAFDRVVTSDLGRAEATAQAVSLAADRDDRWRELDMGEWDGMHRDDIFARFRHQMDELDSGKDIKWGGAESYGEFVARIDAAFDDLVADLGDDEHAVVVTHGGVIHAVVAKLLNLRATRRPWPIGRIFNTSLTTITVDGDTRQVRVFNDGAHLPPRQRSPRTDGRAVTLIRHGQTHANAEHRWQGIVDGMLNDHGHAQARAVAGHVDPMDVLYSSRLSRARDTARHIAAFHDVEHREHEDLREMHFGEWEDLTTPEIRARFDDEWRQVYEHNLDVPRGRNGETFADVAKRMQRVIEEVAAGSHVGVVSHGGAIWAYVADLLGLGFEHRQRLGYPRNTSTSRIVQGDRGPVVLFHNVAPHLDEGASG